jgi:hypothetical protein
MIHDTGTHHLYDVRDNYLYRYQPIGMHVIRCGILLSVLVFQIIMVFFLPIQK